MFKVLDLFSGIGGFSLGLERTGGFETVAFCEIEKFPQKVLKKHWPEVPIYEDVRNVTREQLAADGIFPNVITGGFPCQDISVAGKQKGISEGTRSGLWSECARLLGEIRPDYAIFENVTALLSGDNGRWFQRILWDISEVGGYEVEWHCIPASSVGAHHQRDRVWIVLANTNELPNGQQHFNAAERHDSEKALHNLADPNSERLQGLWQGRSLQEWSEATRHCGQGCKSSGWSWATEPSICRVANGIPDRAHRLKGLGNAVVPQIPELIGRAILEANNGL
jgi:DNA (cytosine-5)-methyltransferase 1